MNDFLKMVASILLGCFVVFGAIGFFLPSEVHVERSVEIDADASVIYPLISDARNVAKWVPWPAMDESLEYYDVRQDGYFWKASALGNGTLEIGEREGLKSVRYKVFFDDGRDVDEKLLLAPQENGTTLVQWIFTDTVDEWFVRYTSVLSDLVLGPALEKGLVQLKDAAEKIQVEQDNMQSGYTLTTE